jgi:Cd2+/Zn2+-exporting ATPase
VTTKQLDLPVLLPRGAECEACVLELSQAMAGLPGISDVSSDVTRGRLHVGFDPAVVTYDELVRRARRVAAHAHCPVHCPDGVHEHGELDLSLVAPDATTEVERRIAHVTGLDCADCALKLENALRAVPGVIDAEASFGASTLQVAYDPGGLTYDEVLRRITQLGYGTLEAEQAKERTQTFDVAGMDCADCAAKLEARLARLDGVSAARVDFGLARLTVVYSPARTPEAALRAAADELGYRIAEGRRRERRFWLSDRRATATIASGVLVVAGFAAEALAPTVAPYLFAAAMVVGGSYVARAAFYSLRARQVDMNVLMTTAAVGAAAIGQWSEAGLVVFLFALGNVLQAASMERTRRAIRSLVELTPDQSTVVRDGRESRVAAVEVVVGDTVVLRPGERVAVDGVVIDGSATVDQAAITGESLPVTREPGDRVFAGSIVSGSTLSVRATSTAGDNTIARIIHLVEEAQASRAPVESTVDRFAARYTPAVVAAAAVVAVVPPLLGAPLDTWLYRALALLIISCPCALVISTPVSIVSALGAASRRGVLVKGGAYLEQAHRLQAVAFDKTGTLTTGTPEVTDVVALDGIEPDDLLALAATVERPSEHALARAIVDAARAGNGHDADHAEGSGDPCRCTGHGCACDDDARAEHFRAVVGKGVRAEIDGETYLVGLPGLWVGDDAVTVSQPRVRAEMERLRTEGKTAVVVGTPRRALGLIAVADAVRAESQDALHGLREQGVQRIVMLTGDNRETAEAIGQQAGVDEVRAGLLPEEKVDAVRELTARYGAVGMVGDGVNDAPALAAASVGIAMGAAGTDAALETADIALMGDDLEALPDLISLSRRTVRVIRQNMAVSIAIKAVFLALAPLGLVTLWMAVFADVGTSLLVIGNGLRLQRGSAGRR